MPTPLDRRFQVILGALTLCAGLWACATGLVALHYAAIPRLHSADRGFYACLATAATVLGLICVVTGLRTIRRYPAPPARGTSGAMGLIVMMLVAYLLSPHRPWQASDPGPVSIDEPLTQADLSALVLNLGATGAGILTSVLVHRRIRRREDSSS